MLRLDHVVYAVPDLDEAAIRFREAFGLDSIEGGRHERWGTANRIVPLGDQYMELVAAVDEAAAARTGFGRGVLERASGGGGWFGAHASPRRTLTPVGVLPCETRDELTVRCPREVAIRQEERPPRGRKCIRRRDPSEAMFGASCVGVGARVMEPVSLGRTGVWTGTCRGSKMTRLPSERERRSQIGRGKAGWLDRRNTHPIEARRHR